jgi:hypothetical protein
VGCGFVLYLILLGTFTFTEPVSQEREVKGVVLKDSALSEIEAIRKKGKPHYSVDEYLSGKENDPENVWTSWSITLMQVVLVVVWLAMFISLSMFIGTFVMFQKMNVIGQAVGPIKEGP